MAYSYDITIGRSGKIAAEPCFTAKNPLLSEESLPGTGCGQINKWGKGRKNRQKPTKRLKSHLMIGNIVFF